MVKRQPSMKRQYLPKPYPENLILTLMRGTLESVEVTPDIQAGLDYALLQLTAIEQAILKLRFQERLTYQQIGIVRGRTGHGACGAENNAMRKLRHHSRLGYILYGKEGFESMGGVFHFPWEAPLAKEENKDPKVLLLPFEQLDLSVRSFNSLRRAGYEFVGDIVNLTYEQILEIKSLPRQNCIEIAVELRKLGLIDTGWKVFL